MAVGVKYVHSCNGSTHLEGISGTMYVAFSCWLDVVQRRSLVSAPAASPVLHAGISEVPKLADINAFVLAVGRGNVVPTGEKTPGELDAIPIPVYIGVQTVTAVLLTGVGVVSAETWLRS